MPMWKALAGCLVLALGAASVAHGNEPRLRLVGLLELPTRGDGFDQPRAVHADPASGEVFVCDTLNHRLAIFDASGLYLHTIVGGAAFRAPIDVAVDAEGYLFVLAVREGRRGVVALDFDGAPLGMVELSGLPPEAPPPELVSLALSPRGDRLYLLDHRNQRLWIADRQGHLLNSVDLAVGLSEKQAEEQALGHVDVYGETVLVTVSTAGQVLVLDLDGHEVGRLGAKGTTTCQTAFPVAAALDRAGDVVILDKQRAVFNFWNLRSRRCLGDHGNFGTARGAFYQPGDLTVDRSGRIYIAQGFEGRVQVLEPVEEPAAR